MQHDPSDRPADGGPAFPFDVPPGFGHLTTTGMSLRDWFAGQTAAGMASSGDWDATREHAQAQIAATAYELADAMLKVRIAPHHKGTASAANYSRDVDIGILLAQIDAARKMGGLLSDDPYVLALTEQIRATWKARANDRVRASDVRESA